MMKVVEGDEGDPECKFGNSVSSKTGKREENQSAESESPLYSSLDSFFSFLARSRSEQNFVHGIAKFTLWAILCEQ